MRTFFEDIWWFIRYRIIEWFLDVPHKIRCYRLKLKRGFSKCDTYSLYWVLSKTIYKALKAFKEDNGSWSPIDFESPKEWEEALDKMIFSFQALYREELDNVIFDDKKYNNLQNRIQEGLDLFAKYFQNLWW